MMCNLYQPCYYVVVLVALLLIAIGIVPIAYRDELETNVPADAKVRPVFDQDVTPLLLLASGILLVAAGGMLLLQSFVRFWVLHPTTSCCPTLAERSNQEMAWMLHGRGGDDGDEKGARPALLYAAARPQTSMRSRATMLGMDLKTHPLKRGMKFYRAPEERTRRVCTAAPPPPLEGLGPPTTTPAEEAPVAREEEEKPPLLAPLATATADAAVKAAAAAAAAEEEECAACVADCASCRVRPAAVRGATECAACCNPLSPSPGPLCGLLPPPAVQPARLRRLRRLPEVTLHRCARERPPPYTHPLKPMVFYKVPPKDRKRGGDGGGGGGGARAEEALGSCSKCLRDPCACLPDIV